MELKRKEKGLTIFLQAWIQYTYLPRVDASRRSSARTSHKPASFRLNLSERRRIRENECKCKISGCHGDAARNTGKQPRSCVSLTVPLHLDDDEETSDLPARVTVDLYIGGILLALRQCVPLFDDTRPTGGGPTRPDTSCRCSVRSVAMYSIRESANNKRGEE